MPVTPAREATEPRKPAVNAASLFAVVSFAAAIAQLALLSHDWGTDRGYGVAMLGLLLPMAFWSVAGVGALALLFHTVQARPSRPRVILNLLTIACVIAGIVAASLGAPGVLAAVGE